MLYYKPVSGRKVFTPLPPGGKYPIEGTLRTVTRFSLFCCLLAAAAIAPASAQTRFQGTDIGPTATGGSTIFDPAAGAYRITGGGENMWGPADAFHFASLPLSGDFNLEADIRFEGQGGGAPHRKAALIVRQNLEPGSPYADIAVHGDGLTSLQFRTAPGAPTQEVRSPRSAPTHLRLERRGSQITVYAGTSAGEMDSTGPVTVALQDPVQAGLAVCSHQAGKLETAIFSNVRVEPAASSPPAVRYRSKVSILRLSDRGVRTVFAGSGVYEAPNWSRDGKYLLINSGGRLLRLPVDGGTPEPLNMDASLRCNNDHDYSPDGTMLAFSASSPSSRQSQVYVAAADGSQARLLVPAAPSYFHGWAPDGKVLAFVGQRNGNFDLFRVTAAGGGPEEPLTTHAGYDDGPDYSPDGRWIYFNSDRSGGWDVWRMPAAGAGPGDKFAQQVTRDAMEDWFPHPSPDGKWLVLFSFPEGTKGHNGRVPGVHLRLLPLPGEKLGSARPEVIATFFGGQGSINVNSWSPDSSQLAFVIYEPEGQPATK